MSHFLWLDLDHFRRFSGPGEVGFWGYLNFIWESGEPFHSTPSSSQLVAVTY